MLLNDFIDIMNKLAPQETALGFDNVGLIIGTDRKQIKRVLVALDCTLAVALEAVEIGADLVLTHHPLLFRQLSVYLPNALKRRLFIPLSATVLHSFPHIQTLMQRKVE